MQKAAHSSHYVIDFQGFKAKGVFFIQEFAAFDLRDQSILHLFFSHDFKLNEFDFSSYCCHKNLHKINKSFGSSNFSKLKDFFSSNSASVYFVKGIEQCLILAEFCSNNIINIDSLSTNFQVQNHFHLKCPYQEHNSHVNFNFCSLKRAYSFGYHLLDHYKYNPDFNFFEKPQ